MNVVDSISLVLIILFTLMGFKKGAIKSIVSLIGFFVIIFLSYKLKGPVCGFFIKHLPFFELGGPFKGLSSVSILVYEGISFLLVFVLLYAFLRIILKITGLIDKIIKATVILDIPSKIIGAVLGFIEGIVFVFSFAFIMLHYGPTQKYIMESDLTMKIVESTPLMSNVFGKTIDASKEIYSIVSSKNEDKKTNDEIIDALVKNGIITKKEAKKIKNKASKMED